MALQVGCEWGPEGAKKLATSRDVTIIAQLPGGWSPEAKAAAAAFEAHRDKLLETLLAIPSGVALVDSHHRLG